MTKFEMQEGISELQQFFGKELSEFAIEKYHESLKHISLECFNYTVREYIRTTEFAKFPMPGTLLKVAGGFKAAHYDETKSNPEWERAWNEFDVPAIEKRMGLMETEGGFGDNWRKGMLKGIKYLRRIGMPWGGTILLTVDQYTQIGVDMSEFQNTTPVVNQVEPPEEAASDDGDVPF